MATATRFIDPDDMTPDERDRQADLIIAETCRRMPKHADTSVPFLNALSVSWHWLQMLRDIAACYDASFDGSVVMELLRHKPLVLAAVAGHLAAVGIAEDIGEGDTRTENAVTAISATLTYTLGKIYKESWRQGRDPRWEEVIQALKNTGR